MTQAGVTPIDFGTDRAAVARALDALQLRYLGDQKGAVSDSIRYALQGEGKRLRAVLVMAAHRAAGGKKDVSGLAAAVEVVHAYSLVHDDLPCMDDDDMRRGRPTVHKVFGVPAATAAGMAMVPLAARVALDAAMDIGLTSKQGGAIVRTLMQASGATGMIGGQLLDLEGEGRELNLEELERIHRWKTGALIEAAMTIGGIAAGASPALLQTFATYGASVGLAFQIADDVLDITATTDQLGKTAGKDLAFKKSTYPALLGIAGAKARAEALVQEACKGLAEHEALTPELEFLARFIVARRS
ncbi:polyprenyl synthetase family protein [Pseudogemmatithrix spongiicola]|uniref:Polyprenyl synthetase family protein n=1 Tax=Pseudogemmatithrix spongiicola TaxID=3062599 RepID=A0AA49Q510_9BACT|nr:polyprenyl synthetase family protein [Gemmatimonadaceae bacterium 'strain 138']WKW15309.1 polyprenyl synthetase family protein [Gemmatimonadaceae bacterium 'strain 318']